MIKFTKSVAEFTLLFHYDTYPRTHFSIVPPVCVPQWFNFCIWTPWYDDEFGKVKSAYAPAQEVELLADAQHFPGFPDGCSRPRDIECMTVDTEEFSNETADASTCDVSTGLSCANRPGTPLCADYKVRYFCCSRRYTVTCSTPQPPETTTVVETTTPQTTTEGNHGVQFCFV